MFEQIIRNNFDPEGDSNTRERENRNILFKTRYYQKLIEIMNFFWKPESDPEK